MGGPIFKRSEHAISADVCDDVVALQIKLGNCFGMENVTASVWRLLAEPRSLESLCESLTSEYEVDLEVCRSEVGQLMDQLVNEGLVEKLPE